MAWEHADIIFPSGFNIIDGEFVSNEELKSSNIDAIYKDQDKQACNMIIEKLRYTWRKNGQLEIDKLYDVYGKVPHATTNIRPLNVYGMAMVNDYLAINNIQF